LTLIVGRIVMDIRVYSKREIEFLYVLYFRK